MAFSFAGEQRELVRAIAEAVEKELGYSSVFFDEWFEHYIAGHDADLTLHDIYGERCDLAVVCVSKHYGGKPWTQSEHEAIRARLMKSRSSELARDEYAILPIRVGDGDVKGILFNTIAPDVRKKSIVETVNLIIERLRLIVPDAGTNTLHGHYDPMPPVAAVHLVAMAAGGALQIPQSPFHCGPWVPPNYFVGRYAELARARQLINMAQNFLIVGRPRAGKTSFCRKLYSDISSDKESRLLVNYMNLEQGSQMTIESFMEHTILCIVGEVAREAFGCRYSDLRRKNPAEGHPSLANDELFRRFVNLFRVVSRYTHDKPGSRGKASLVHEFVRFTDELVEITRERGFAGCVMFYDEANRLPRDISVELLNNIGEALSQTGVIGAYAASPEMAEYFDRLPGLIGQHIELGPFQSSDEMRRLLARYYFNDVQRVRDLPVTEEALGRLWEVSLGRPFPIQLVSDAMFAIAAQSGASHVELTHVAQAFEAAIRSRPEAFS